MMPYETRAPIATDEAFNSGYKLALKHVTAMAQELGQEMAPQDAARFVFVVGAITGRLEGVINA